jgi:hypothetical protein
MTTKTVDTKGRRALGRHFAGQLVLIDDSDPERIIIQKAQAIPAREAWLYQNQKALNLVRQGLADVREGRFSKTPPDLDADAELTAELQD